MDTKKLLIGGVAGGTVLAVCALLNSQKEEEVEVDEDVFIPSPTALKEIKRKGGKSDEEIRREEALMKIKRGPRQGCGLPEGSIARVRNGEVLRSYVPRINLCRERKMREIPAPTGGDPKDFPDADEMWASPKKNEYMTTAKDGTRWQWSNFTTLDDASQLVSTQHTYTSEGYGLKIVLIPTLRLADRKFFDFALSEALVHEAVVIVETLHHEQSSGVLKQVEMKTKERKQPYTRLSANDAFQIQQHAFQRGTKGDVSQEVGGECVTLDYLTTLIEAHTHWLLGDTGLNDEEMTNIGATVNALETYRSLCHKREVSLFSVIDQCVAAAATTESWKKLTGQEKEGDKVIVLPWNGRHCSRIEKFLTTYRGFKATEERKHRIIFESVQVSNMVRRASAEDTEDLKESVNSSLKETALPESTGKAPLHNFGEFASLDNLNVLKELSTMEKSESLKAVVEAGTTEIEEAEEAPVAAEPAEAEAEEEVEEVEEYEEIEEIEEVEESEEAEPAPGSA